MRTLTVYNEVEDCKIDVVKDGRFKQFSWEQNITFRYYSCRYFQNAGSKRAIVFRTTLKIQVHE